MLWVIMKRELTVREIMSRDFVGVSEADEITDVAKVLRDEDAEVAAVVRGHEPVGVISALDLLPLVPQTVNGGTAAEYMREPAGVTSPEQPLIDALDWMSTHRSGRLLVTEDEELVGILTASDALTAAASLLENGTRDRVGSEPVGADPVGSPNAEPAVGQTTATEPDAEYSTQSVCESCGTLTQQLQNFNGQMLCADCRDI